MVRVTVRDRDRVSVCIRMRGNVRVGVIVRVTIPTLGILGGQGWCGEGPIMLIG